MKYKNICKFPIFIKSVGKQIAPGKVFEEISNSELNTLLKERKIEVIQYEDFVKKIEPKSSTKKSKKSYGYNEKKTDEEDTNKNEEDE